MRLSNNQHIRQMYVDLRLSLWTARPSSQNTLTVSFAVHAESYLPAPNLNQYLTASQDGQFQTCHGTTGPSRSRTVFPLHRPHVSPNCASACRSRAPINMPNSYFIMARKRQSPKREPRELPGNGTKSNWNIQTFLKHQTHRKLLS